MQWNHACFGVRRVSKRTYPRSECSGTSQVSLAEVTSPRIDSVYRPVYCLLIGTRQVPRGLNHTCYHLDRRTRDRSGGLVAHGVWYAR
ncbi:hypothetical protein E2C01_077278 [Portunus trituberculatus]|uniref:Uncharacterized protein n=1 Tax=Portunus trituberculatus TaxID=210409 RepID=A0A5B7IJX4_PORTR|nr:hypothetical protein [Portunus trituberculatus]